MKHKQTGFTLIELVIVIVVLGILAAVALPRFVDLGSDARTAAIQGAAGALAAYSATNYATYQVATAKAVRLSNTSPGSSLTASMAGWDSTKFAFSSQVACGTASAGSAVNATLTYSGGTASVNSAVASIICTG